MRKLFNLKEWLTVADAARHLSIVFGEDVTEADVLHLALDGRLRLSVYLVNRAKARCGVVVRYSDAELAAAINSGNLPQDLKWIEMPKDLGAAIRWEEAGKKVLRIDDGSYLILDKKVLTLRGVWDLPMIGNELLNIEHEYQKLTGGPAVTLQGLDGAFVEGRNGQICQLQEDFEDDEYRRGSVARLNALKLHIESNGLDDAEADALLNPYEEDRIEFLAKLRALPLEETYYTAEGLPKDAVIVVRSQALREFEQFIDGAPTRHTNVSDKLALMNQASAKFWANADRDDRGTHPTNAAVAAWLVQQGFTQTLAEKSATLIRPEWAPTGRKPEE